MDRRRGSDDQYTERTAHHIQALHEAVLAFRNFLTELSDCERSELADTMPWTDGGSEIWLDFEAWVHVMLHDLRDPQQRRSLK